MLTVPMVKVVANTALAESHPCMSVIDVEATLPVTSRVMPRLAPCSTKKVPRVTSSQPLKAPMARETTSARITPTHTLRPKFHEASAAVSPDVVAATPVDRSNSPPIMRTATPTAMIPIVAEP